MKQLNIQYNNKNTKLQYRNILKVENKMAKAPNKI